MALHKNAAVGGHAGAAPAATGSRTRYRFRLLDGLAEVSPAAWDGLHHGHPALAHAFLHTLETTGCVGPRTGWLPRHATLWEGERLVAAAPLYEKHNSWGEYVFDWAWAQAYARHGLRYYPKWLIAPPFSPLPGPRLLGRCAEVRRALLAAVLEMASASEHSSLHVLFPDDEELAWLEEAGLLVRRGVQFHWHNATYADFDAFLASLNHDKRKKIRQERRRAAAHGLEYRWLDGRGAGAAAWDFFYRCYATTYALHRSTPYLTAEFFPELARLMPDRIRLLVASRSGRPVASALFLCDEAALYGRYWGCVEYLPYLHFELCYYRPIEYCIEHRLARFEGGAQGEHKLARGLQPVVTSSAHWIRDERFRDAVDRYLAQERAGIGLYVDELTERSPFRASEATAPPARRHPTHE